jgi:hypothetical protein
MPPRIIYIQRTPAGTAGSVLTRSVSSTRAVTAVVLIAVYHDHHQTAERYRESLAQAGGRYFQAEPLAEADGDRGGVAIPLPSIEVDRNGSWGGAIPVNLYKVASIRLLGNGPGEILQASFPRGVSERD